MRAEYDRIRTAFDALAPIYDDVFSPAHNPNFARLRAHNLELLSNMFTAGAWLLDVGCGAGDDAIALARAGCKVWGIDISPRMIDLARARVKAAGLEQQITLHVLPAHRLGELVGEIPEERLTGAYSSFGVLNLEPDLAAVRDGLFRLVRPSGRVALTVFNDQCLFERFYHLTHLSPAKARRRQATPGELEVPGPNGPVQVPARYLEAQALADAFKPSFSVDRVFAGAVLTPPLGLPDVFKRHQGLFGPLSRLEGTLRENIYAIRNSDHYMLVMRRENTELAGRPHGPQLLANG